MIEVNNRSLIKSSNKKIFFYGNKIEYRFFEKPYFYNFAPKRNIHARSWGSVSFQKRHDHILRSRTTLKRLVEANAQAFGEIPKFFTFTFAENIENLTEAHDFWRLYQKRLRHFFGKSFKYIAVPEFQKRGAVHYHVIYFDMPYVENMKEIFSDLWTFGFFKIEAITDIEKVTKYIIKYISKGNTDMRMYKRRTFYTSQKLLRPIEVRDSQDIDDLLFFDTMNILATYQYYNSRYGKVEYTLYGDSKKSNSSITKRTL